MADVLYVLDIDDNGNYVTRQHIDTLSKNQNQDRVGFVATQRLIDDVQKDHTGAQVALQRDLNPETRDPFPPRFETQGFQDIHIVDKQDTPVNYFEVQSRDGKRKGKAPAQYFHLSCGYVDSGGTFHAFDGLISLPFPD